MDASHKKTLMALDMSDTLKNLKSKFINQYKYDKNFTCHDISDFHLICTGSNKSQVEDYLKSGVAVNSRVKTGRFRDYTALHFAVLYNRIEIVQLLLNWNAQVNFNTDQAPTPLHLACKCDFVKYEEIHNQCNYTKLNKASVDWTLNRTNQLNIIKLLLLHGAEIDTTALLSACKFSYSFPCNHPFKCYINCCFKDEICFRTKEIIEILLLNNANIKITVKSTVDYTKESILHIIGRNSYLKQSEEFVKFVLTKGADVHAIDHNGYTPLHNAINQSDWNLVQIYLKHKTVNDKTKDLLTPLELLYYNIVHNEFDHRVYRDVLCAFLENGSEVNIRLENGRMIVLDAIQNCRPFMIERLLQYGADIIAEESQEDLVSLIIPWENNLNGLEWGDRVRETFRIVFIHVQKLWALGCINEQLEQLSIKLCELYKNAEKTDNLKNLDYVYSKCMKELDRMKLVKIDNYTSLYSILIKDAHELSKHVKNETLVKILKNPNIGDDFPFYYNLLLIQYYKKGLVRSDALQSANTALSSAIGLNLPDLCCDSILQYLTNEEIVHLKIAAKTSCKLSNRLTLMKLPKKF